MAFILKNDSQYTGKRGTTDWWNWTAKIESTPPDSLDDIDYVEYYLHPSFPNPVRRVYKKDEGFPLESSGWGVFELKAQLFFKNNEKPPIFLSHVLEFEDSGIG